MQIRHRQNIFLLQTRACRCLVSNAYPTKEFAAMYILVNQAGRYLQPDNSAGTRATARRFARYVDAFNSCPRGWRVVDA